MGLCVAVSYLFASRLAAVAGSTERLQIRCVIAAAFFEREDVINVGGLAAHHTRAAAACAGVADQDPLASGSPIGG